MKHRIIFGLSAGLFIAAALTYDGSAQSCLITASLVLFSLALWFFISKN